MNHSSQSDQPPGHRYVSFQFESDRESLSPSLQVTRTVNTGVTYSPLPQAKLLLAKPQQASDFRSQIEADFAIRYRQFTDGELDYLLDRCQTTDFHRYKSSYHRLYASVLQSILNCVDINEENSQIKHAITHKNELLPILVHNHAVAKQEKQILYHLVTRSWQKFDERLQTETHVHSQLEQVQQERRHLLKRKIEQEQRQALRSKLFNIQKDLSLLRQEIQQLQAYKQQLQDQMREITSQRSYHLKQLDFLKSHVIRAHTQELNHLQLERDSLLTQSELIKYAFFEQIQQADHILSNYRTSLNSFRSTLYELEQQLKQQTDNELTQLQQQSLRSSAALESPIMVVNRKDSMDPARLTIRDDSQRLISILENKIEDKRMVNSQLEKTIADYEEKILRQQQQLTKKEKESVSLNHRDNELDQKMTRCREQRSQAKIERRAIEHRLATLIKQQTNDERLDQTLKLCCESLQARQKLEQQRDTTFVERLHPLVDENHRLKLFNDQLHRQASELMGPALLELQGKLVRLRETHQWLVQEKFRLDQTSTSHQQADEQLRIKNSRTATRVNHLLQRMKTHEQDARQNTEHLDTLERQLSEEQHRYLQWTYALTEMKNRSAAHRTQQQSLQMQTQVAANKIQHCHHRLENFTEQLSVCRHDSKEQQISLTKLREFHEVLQEQDGISTKNLSTRHTQLIRLQCQCRSIEGSLEQTREQLTKHSGGRTVLARMVIRRVTLCQLLYRDLGRLDERTRQRDRQIQTVTTCVHSVISQIRRTRDQNRQSIQRKDQVQLEVVQAHLKKLLYQSHEKQLLLTEQIFQRRCSEANSMTTLPTEEVTYLRNKYFLLKNRWIKIVCRDIICHLALISIQQEFVECLRAYTSKTSRGQQRDLQSLRTDLYRLMRRLKAKTAENNMLIDYQWYFQLIRTDTLLQLTEWTNFLESDDHAE